MKNLLKTLRVAFAHLYPALLVATQVYFPVSLFWLKLIRSEPVDICKYRRLFAKLMAMSFFFQDMVGAGFPLPLHSNSTVSFTRAVVSLGGISIHTGKAEIRNRKQYMLIIKIGCTCSEIV